MMALTTTELSARLSKLPRVNLAHLPTPLEHMPRLSAELGGPQLFVKREDLTGLAYGGNKARHYEYEMPHVVAGGFDTLINIMDYHSNNARMTAAAAVRVGLEYHLILCNAAERAIAGNAVIDGLLTRNITLLDRFQSVHALGLANELAEQLAQKGHRPYLLQDHLFPRLAGMIAYINAGIELASQIEKQGLHNVHIIGVLGRSLCGLLLAALNLGLDWRFTGVTVTHNPMPNEYVFQYSHDITQLLNLPIPFTRSDMHILYDYVGEGYGLFNRKVGDAIKLLGRTEGLLADPNYTGKVVAALTEQVTAGNCAPDENIIMLHTGGLPGIFTFARELSK